MMSKNLKLLHKGKKLSPHSLFGFIRSRDCSSAATQSHTETTKSQRRYFSDHILTTLFPELEKLKVWYSSSALIQFSKSTDEITDDWTNDFISGGFSFGTGEHFFQTMLKMTPKPSIKVFNFLLRAFSVREGYFTVVDNYKQLLACADCQPDIITTNIVIDCCPHFNRGDLGFSVFAITLKKGISPDVFTYSALISCHFAEGRIQEAISLFEDMKDQGFPPANFTFHNLIHWLCQSGKLEDAQRFFFRMIASGIVSHIDTGTALIRCLRNQDKIQEAFSVFEKMIRRGFSPNVDTFSALLPARSKSEILKLGGEFYALLAKEKTSEALNAIQEIVYTGQSGRQNFCGDSNSRDQGCHDNQEYFDAETGVSEETHNKVIAACAAFLSKVVQKANAEADRNMSSLYGDHHHTFKYQLIKAIELEKGVYRQ